MTDRIWKFGSGFTWGAGVPGMPTVPPKGVSQHIFYPISPMLFCWWFWPWRSRRSPLETSVLATSRKAWYSAYTCWPRGSWTFLVKAFSMEISTAVIYHCVLGNFLLWFLFIGSSIHLCCSDQGSVCVQLASVKVAHDQVGPQPGDNNDDDCDG